jgi:hypothetical protein
MESSGKHPRAHMAKRDAEQLAEEDAERATTDRSRDEMVEDIDDLLAEIDAVLEEQSVLTNFRQKGGE